MTKPVAVFCVTTPMSIPLFGNRFHLLVEAGIDLHIVVGESITESIPELPTEAQVHVVPMTRSINPIGDFVALLKMMKLQRTLRPKLVAAATPKASLIGLLAARLNRVPVRVWEVWGAKWDRNSSHKGRLLRLMDRLVAKSSTNVFSVSRSLSQLLRDNHVVDNHLEMVGHGSTKGVDLSIFCPQDFDLRERTPTIGFVGRLSKDKGIEDVYAVATVLRKDVPDLQLLLVGEIDRTDPPTKEIVNSLHKSDWIEVTGWVSDTSFHYQRMDILIFPSRREGLPNVLLEAASSCTPAIAYSATGSKDVIIDRVTGYLVEAGNVTDMCEQTLRLLQSDSAIEVMGRNSRAMIQNKYDHSKVQQLWNAKYLDLLYLREPVS